MRRRPALGAGLPDSGDAEAFRDAVRDVKPLAARGRVAPLRARPAPLPMRRPPEERALLEELARSDGGGAGAVPDDDTAWVRPGLPKDLVRKLRRTHWAIQADLDLHGESAEAAARATLRFLDASRAAGLRCVRIIHGKGLRSPGREPVLKRRVRQLLASHAEVLAFAEPPPAEGGSGVVVVLLQA